MEGPVALDQSLSQTRLHCFPVVGSNPDHAGKLVGLDRTGAKLLSDLEEVVI